MGFRKIHRKNLVKRELMGDKKANVGSIGWIDLTIPNAEGIGDFY